MIKRMSLIVRRADLSREAFFKHWEEVHGPLVTRLPGLQRYVQHRFVGEIPAYVKEAPELVVDGIAELWFDTLEHASMNMSSTDPDQLAAMRDGFLMSGRSKTYVVDQKVFIKGPDEA